ncbi:MAG: hypothetical protein [Olavius algarvensis Gamma 3 endosymbiont]|nr:MAG: hypothetical protein [Olavius algarvensis Gamma 3 endosymbiont]
MKISITGGNGFIGRNLVGALSQRGCSIKMLSRRADCGLPPGVQKIQGDLVSVDCPMNQFVADSEIIFHCAGEVRDEATMRLLHVDATQRLLDVTLDEASRRGRIIHWVQLSSAGAYGPPPDGAHSERIVTEETKTIPVGEYEITKTIADERVIRACESDLMTYSIVRPSNVYGRNMPNQSLRALSNMIRKRLFFYIGKPGAVATYVHVNDVVEVLLRCGLDKRARGEIFNISNDCMLEDLINGIAQSTNVPPPRLRVPEPLVRTTVSLIEMVATIPLTQKRIDALVSRTRYPCHKLESKLDYRPKVTVVNSIEEALLA